MLEGYEVIDEGVMGHGVVADGLEGREVMDEDVVIKNVLEQISQIGSLMFPKRTESKFK